MYQLRKSVHHKLTKGMFTKNVTSVVYDGQNMKMTTNDGTTFNIIETVSTTHDTISDAFIMTVDGVVFYGRMVMGPQEYNILKTCNNIKQDIRIPFVHAYLKVTSDAITPVEDINMRKIRQGLLWPSNDTTDSVITDLLLDAAKRDVNLLIFSMLMPYTVSGIMDTTFDDLFTIVHTLQVLHEHGIVHLDPHLGNMSVMYDNTDSLSDEYTILNRKFVVPRNKVYIMIKNLGHAAVLDSLSEDIRVVYISSLCEQFGFNVAPHQNNINDKLFALDFLILLNTATPINTELINYISTYITTYSRQNTFDPSIIFDTYSKYEIL